MGKIIFFFAKKVTQRLELGLGSESNVLTTRTWNLSYDQIRKHDTYRVNKKEVSAALPCVLLVHLENIPAF
jgi:hypothetical protein